MGGTWRPGIRRAHRRLPGHGGRAPYIRGRRGPAIGVRGQHGFSSRAGSQRPYARVVVAIRIGVRDYDVRMLWTRRTDPGLDRRYGPTAFASADAALVDPRWSRLNLHRTQD